MDFEAASKTIGTCRTLNKYCKGIMARMLYVNSTMLVQGGSKRPSCLSSVEFGKMKKKLESSFPECPEAIKTPQFDLLASQFASQLQDVYDCFEEAACLKEGMFKVLKEVSGSGNGPFPTLKLDLTPTLITNFMELWLNYIKLHMIASRIEDRKSVLGFYFASASATHRRSDSSWNTVSNFFSASDEPIKHLYNEVNQNSLNNLKECVLQCLNEIVSTVHLYYNTNRFQEMNPLSIVSQGGESALPLFASTPISQRYPSVSLHFELSRSAMYSEWIAYSTLIMPSLTFNSAGLTELFGTIASELLFVDVFRGQALNIHAEMEKLSQFFPPKGMSLPILGKKKLKDYLKDLKKAVGTSSGIKQKRRRYYIIGELERLINIVQRVPGLLGPKFPIIFAALSLARNEVMCYWRHLGQSTGKKGQDSTQYDDQNISTLIGTADKLLGLVTRFTKIIRTYYAEFIKNSHRIAISNLISTIMVDLSDSERFNENMLNKILNLPFFLDFDLSLVEKENTKPLLQEFRWECDRLFGSLSNPMTGLHGGEADALLRRLSTARLHSKLVDSLPNLLGKCAELRDSYWYISALKQDLSTCLYGRDPNLGQYSISYLHVLLTSCNNIYPECPEEQTIVSHNCATSCEEMMGEICIRIDQILDLIVRDHLILNLATSPVEAFNRYERSIIASKARKGTVEAQVSAEEPLPGKESSGQTSEQILILSNYNLLISNLLLAFKSISRGKGIKNIAIIAHDRVIVPIEHISNVLESFFRNFLKKSIVLEDESRVSSPSKAIRMISTCVSVMQKSMEGSGVDVDKIIKLVLLDELSEWNRRSDKESLNAANTQRTILQWMVKYYVYLIKRISPNGDMPLGFVYVKARKSFASIPNGPKMAIQIESYISKCELVAFCSMLGGGGVRALNQELLALVAGRIKEVHQMLIHLTPSLIRFRDSKDSKDESNWHDALRSLYSLDKMFEHITAIGILVTVRSLLREALCSVSAKTMPGLHSTTQAACSMLNSALQNFGDNESVQISPEADLSSFESYAADLGLQISTDEDVGLLNAVHGLKLNPGPWDLLPIACAACFGAEQWKKCRFVCALESYERAEHMAIPAITSLFKVLYGDDKARLSDALIEYTKTASSTLMRMKLGGRPPTGIYRDYKFPEMLAFMDLFVDECGEVSRSVLEELIPYSLTHQAYLEMTKSAVA